MPMVFYDTNAVLELLDKVLETDFYVSVVTLEELENIKTSSHKDAEVKFKARKAIHILDENTDKYHVAYYGEAERKLLADLGLDESNDNKICACAKAVNQLTPITFVTDDICCRVIGNQIFKLDVSSADTNSDDIYRGYKEVVMSDERMAEFFDDMSKNLYDLKIGEYLIISNLSKENVYKWNGEEMVLVSPLKFRTQLSDKCEIKPKNPTQVCAFDSIENNQITMLFGKAGSGKTFLPMAYADTQVEKGRYGKLVVVYSYDMLKGANALGYERGDHIDKLLNYGSLGNILTTKYGSAEGVLERIERGTLEIIPTAYIRGMSLENDIVLVTESQNLDTYTLKTIIQRCGENCKLIIEGDVLEQKDKNLTLTGMQRFTEVFAGEENVGIVKLKGNYRSRMCELADKM